MVAIHLPRPFHTMELLAAVFVGFVVAGFAPWLLRITPSHGGRVLALVPLVLTVYFSCLIDDVALSGATAVRYEWIPSLGVHMSFHVDALALLFALLISGIGTCVFLYGSGYLAGDRDAGRFYLWIMTFMAAMLGLVLADDLITLFVFWELTSISSYMLIGYYHEDERARAAALQALLVTGAGGLALLAGFILLGTAGGTFTISELRLAGDAVREHDLYVPLIGLILFGAFTKSAQFPFHFWLPNAMAAPAPVSSYLHSATMVKAGVYLLARLSPVIGQTVVWELLLVGFGGLTMVWTGLLAVRQTDLKRILAYSTLTVLGALTMLIGAGTQLAVKAAIILLLAHSLYKGALFMVAGIVDHETGERDVTRLGGLFGLLPVTGCAAAVAAFSNAGLPPMLGFVAKEYFYKAKLDLADFTLILTGAALVANAFLVVVAFLVGYRPFYGTRLPTPKHAHEAPWPMLVGPVALAFLGLLFGVLPSDFDTVVLEPAVQAVMGDPTISIELALWHDLVRNPTGALVLSVLTIVAGATMYRRVGRIRALSLPVTPNMEQVYQGAVAGLLSAAGTLTRLLQNGYLRSYLATVVVVSVTLVLSYLISTGVHVPTAHVVKPAVYESVVCVLIMLGAVSAVRAPSRLSAIIALGVVGLGMTMIFFLYSAPDLAETQVFVETLTVILFVLAFYRLPRLADYSSTTTKLRDAGIATMVGIMMACLVLIAGHVQPQETIARYFADNSYTLAMGRNVVNVILVDFRALDTLGEIAVLGVAALGIFALRKLPAREVEGRS